MYSTDQLLSEDWPGAVVYTWGGQELREPFEVPKQKMFNPIFFFVGVPNAKMIFSKASMEFVSCFTRIVTPNKSVTSFPTIPR